MLCDGGICNPDALPAHDSGTNMSNPDAAVTSSTADAAMLDIGGPVGDGGTAATRDAEILDVASLPIIDGGPAYDGGTPTPQALMDEGNIWMGEMTGPNGRYATAGARLDDNSSALFAMTRTNFGVTGGNCEVVVRRTVSGAVTGVKAHRIIIDFSDNPHHAGPVELSSPGNDGYFLPIMMLPSPPLFTVVRPVIFGIQSNGNVGELVATEVTVGAPEVPAVTFPLNQSDGFSVSGNPAITWNIQVSVPNLDFVAEIADHQRSVVLTCRVRDGQARLQIPASALRTWSLASPSPPAQLELRYDETVSQNLARNGGQSLDTVFRISRGSSYPLLP
jgi:hypothetical protein